MIKQKWRFTHSFSRYAICCLIVKFLQDKKKYRKNEQKYQPIFLLVFSGSRVTKSQVYYYTKIELQMSRAGPNISYCLTCAHLVNFYPKGSSNTFKTRKKYRPVFQKKAPNNI